MVPAPPSRSRQPRVAPPPPHPCLPTRLRNKEQWRTGVKWKQLLKMKDGNPQWDSIESCDGEKTHMEQIITSLSEIQAKIWWGEGRFWLQCPSCQHGVKILMFTRCRGWADHWKDAVKKNSSIWHFPISLFFTHIAKIFKTEMRLWWFLAFECSNWELEAHFLNNLQCNKHWTYMIAIITLSISLPLPIMHSTWVLTEKNPNTCGSTWRPK